MQLHPRYDADPIVSIEGGSDAIVAATVRQRRRLSGVLHDFDEEQWAAQTRCAAWTTRDVASHLVSTNGFWTMSVAGALAGEPTRVLASFDPKATPAALAEADTSSAAEVLDALDRSTEALCDVVGDLTREQLGSIGEAPPGHVTLDIVLHHALWDCWIHERDILLPLGMAPTIDADEVGACLRYAAAIAPALTLSREPTRRGRLGVVATEPDLAFVVDVDQRVKVRDTVPDEEPVLRGAAAALVDSLSVRGPLDANLSPGDRWLVAGLAEVFEEV